MKDSEIIKKLNKEGNLKPKNKEFYTNLKKRLINQRSIDLESRIQKEENEKVFLNTPFVMAIGAIAFASILALILVIYPSTTPQKNTTQKNTFNNANQNKTEINIGGNKVVANQFEPEDSYTSVSLPEEWQFVNSEEFDFESGEAAVFESEEKQLVVSQKLSTDKYEALSQENDSAVTEVANYQVLKFNPEKTEFVEDLKYENNYIIRPEKGVSTVIISFNGEEEEYLEALIENLKFDNPYESWIEEELDIIEFIHPSEWTFNEEKETFSVRATEVYFKIEYDLDKVDTSEMEPKYYFGREVYEKKDNEVGIYKELYLKIYETWIRIQISYECPQDDFVCDKETLEMGFSEIEEDMKLFVAGIELKSNYFETETFTFNYYTDTFIAELNVEKMENYLVEEYEINEGYKIYDNNNNSSEFYVLNNNSFNENNFIEEYTETKIGDLPKRKIGDFHEYSTLNTNLRIYVYQGEEKVFIFFDSSLGLDDILKSFKEIK